MIESKTLVSVIYNFLFGFAEKKDENCPEEEVLEEESDTHARDGRVKKKYYRFSEGFARRTVVLKRDDFYVNNDRPSLGLDSPSNLNRTMTIEQFTPDPHETSCFTEGEQIVDTEEDHDALFD